MRLGALSGFFFGILGLLGLLLFYDQSEKDEFMSGWWIGFIIRIVIYVILLTAVFCSACGIY